MATDYDQPDDDWAIFIDNPRNLARIGKQPVNSPLPSNWQWVRDEDDARKKLADLLADGYELADGGW